MVVASLSFAQATKSKSKSPPKAPPKAAPNTSATIKPEGGRTIPPPKETASRDKTLAAFLLRFKAVVKKKDRDGLIAVLAPDVNAGRGTTGLVAFNNAWELTDPNSSVYALLTQILSLPGVWVGEQYCAPYVAELFPADLDPWKYHVVLNPDVKLRATASAKGRVLANLAYDIVEVLERTAEWTKVKTESGLVGYVPAGYTYSPAAYRACFSKNPAGEWKLQSLVSGPNR